MTDEPEFQQYTLVGTTIDGPPLPAGRQVEVKLLVTVVDDDRFRLPLLHVDDWGIG